MGGKKLLLMINMFLTVESYTECLHREQLALHRLYHIDELKEYRVIGKNSRIVIGSGIYRTQIRFLKIHLLLPIILFFCFKGGIAL